VEGYQYYRLAVLYEILAAHGVGAGVAVRWTRNTRYIGSRPVLLAVAGRNDFGTCHTWDLLFLLLPTLGLLAFSMIFVVVVVAMWLPRRRP
jgi:ABC-type antimicrobial peptide transport system permease subunit